MPTPKKAPKVLSPCPSPHEPHCSERTSDLHACHPERSEGPQACRRHKKARKVFSRCLTGEAKMLLAGESIGLDLWLTRATNVNVVRISNPVILSEAKDPEHAGATRKCRKAFSRCPSIRHLKQASQSQPQPRDTAKPSHGTATDEDALNRNQISWVSPPINHIEGRLVYWLDDHSGP